MSFFLYFSQMKKLILLLFIPLVFACGGSDGDSNSPCPNQPNLITYEATNINYNDSDSYNVTLSGLIENIELGDNCEILSITNQGFVYGTNIQPTTSDNVVNANGQDIQYVVTNLLPNTTYYVRTYISNVLGTFYGNEISFIIADLQGPTITLNGDNPTVLLNYDSYQEFGAYAYDLIDGDVSANIQINSNVDDTVEGVYEVTYTVSDSEGNTTTEIRVVEVLGSPIYLDENGVTIKAKEWAETGMSGFIDGVEYFVADNDTSLSLYARYCTTNVTSFQNWFSYETNWANLSPFLEHISSWDVSNAVSMHNMFLGTVVHTGFSSPPIDLSYWDVSNVTTMKGMFKNSQIVNIDIANWNTSNVTDMQEMFSCNSADLINDSCPTNNSLQLNIENWNVSNVTDMSDMFRGRKDISIDLSNWNVSNVTDMSGMFLAATFGENIGLTNWDVSSVTDMSYMFSFAYGFDQDLSEWNVNNVSACSMFCQNTTNWWTLPKPNFTNCSADLGCD